MRFARRERRYKSRRIFRACELLVMTTFIRIRRLRNWASACERQQREQYQRDSGIPATPHRIFGQTQHDFRLRSARFGVNLGSIKISPNKAAFLLKTAVIQVLVESR